jgi:hypothetical protein
MMFSLRRRYSEHVQREEPPCKVVYCGRNEEEGGSHIDVFEYITRKGQER